MKETLLVIGSGTMGTGIAHAAALAGLEARMYDTEPTQVQRAVKTMNGIMDRQVEKGKLDPEEMKRVQARVKAVSSLEEGAKGATFAVEAIIEKVEPKKEIFKALDALLPQDAILATNTSSISITEIARATQDPSRVVGMHFFNPAQLMKLVEVIRGFETADETVTRAKALAEAMGKTPVEVKKDSPGFVVNRILMPLLSEAVKVLEEGIASAEDIDTAVRLGLNHPMGPLTLLDFTGIDVCTYVMDYFHDEFGDPMYAPPQTMKRLMRAGRLGRKTGAGFYTYE